MSGVIQFQKAGRRLRAQSGPDPIVAEIADALHHLGGQAHCDTVINCIAAVRRSEGYEAPLDLADQVGAAFHHHMRTASGDDCLLFLPFGPSSRRWGLSHAGIASQRHKIRMY